jgi:hypothetical protein
MVFEMSDHANQCQFTSVGVRGLVLTSRQAAALDDFLQCFRVLRHFPENAHNSETRNNCFLGSCPGLEHTAAECPLCRLLAYLADAARSALCR